MGGNGDEGDVVGGAVNEEKRGFFGQAGVDEGVSRMGVRGDEAVVQPDGKVLPTEVVRNDKLIDILTDTLLTVAQKVVTPEEEHQHDSKHGYKQHGCARKK